jgi:integrase
MVKILLNENVKKLKEKSKAKNTKDKYQGDWLKFIDYCKNKHSCSPLDVDDLESAYALTCNYLDWLHEDPEAKILKGTSNIPGREKINNNPYSSSSYKSSTIQRILASITYKYRVNGFQFDRKNNNVADTIGAIVRDQKNNKSGQAKELLRKDIELIIDTIPEKSDDYKNIRDKALILVGYFSFCRRSELLGMKYEHLTFDNDGIQILIPFSKTDQKGEGRVILIQKRDDSPKYCPVRALNEWLEISMINSGPLFYRIDKSNSIIKYELNQNNKKISLTDTSFVLILKKRAQNAGLNDCHKISGHSLRIGSITQARINGVPTHEIMKMSGHKTEQMINRYTKITDIKSISVGKKI